MEDSKNYFDLDVWVASRELCNEVYTITKTYPKEELFGLVSQIRRSAVSVVSNIAEGCGRQYAKETIQFLHISRGSIFELESQIFVSLDQKYIDQNSLQQILEKITRCKKLLNGFINYYNKLS